MPFLFATVLLDLIGFGIIIPILPFMAPTLGASNFDIAMLIAVYSLCGALVGPFWGRLSDRIGRKPVLLICLAGAALSYVLLAFASTLALLYASRILAGLMAGNFAVASAMVADISTPDKRARNMGLLGAAFGLGLVIGPALGGILAGDDGRYLLVGLVAAGLSLAAMLAGAVMVKESLSLAQRKQHHEERNQSGHVSLLSMLRKTRNSMLVGQFFLANNCHTTVSYLFPLWVGAYLGWSAKEVGLVFGIQGLAMAVLQSSLIGHMVRVLGERWVLVMGTALMSTGFTFLALANSQNMILAGFFTAITGGTLCTPVLNSLLAERTPAALRGRMLGTAGSSSAFGRVAGPLLAGALLSLGNFHIAWLGGLAMAALMLGWAGRQVLYPSPPATEVVATTGSSS